LSAHDDVPLFQNATSSVSPTVGDALKEIGIDAGDPAEPLVHCAGAGALPGGGGVVAGVLVGVGVGVGVGGGGAPDGVSKTIAENPYAETLEVEDSETADVDASCS
jgi:hypothetical protein